MTIDEFIAEPLMILLAMVVADRKNKKRFPAPLDETIYVNLRLGWRVGGANSIFPVFRVRRDAT